MPTKVGHWPSKPDFLLIELAQCLVFVLFFPLLIHIYESTHGRFKKKKSKDSSASSLRHSKVIEMLEYIYDGCNKAKSRLSATETTGALLALPNGR